MNLSTESEKRANSVRKLESFLLNPGRFSILFLGKRGTGQTHWLNEIQKEHQKEDCLGKIITLNGMRVKNSNQEYWEEIFKKADKNLLVIEDIEELSKESQEILFEGLSTGKGGKYGFDKKEYEFRIVFTSTLDIEKLKDKEEKIISYKFFDRISQLVVKLPSYQDTDTRQSIWQDFEKTWKKMDFKNHDELPHEELKNWLETHAEKLHGNFRDLDKIAINWHHNRSIGIKEDKILATVNSDFKDFLHFPPPKKDEKNIFYLDSTVNWKENEKEFKRFYKDWLKTEYGSLKEGADKADVSYRTLESW